jgi:hypothetical protein
MSGPATVAETRRRRFLGAAPAMAALPVVFAVLLHGLGWSWAAWAGGVAGWLLALALRAPLAIVRSRAPRLLVAAAGPLEEGVRLLALATLGRGLAVALALGQGWATVEVLYAIAAGFATLGLLARADERAAAAERALAEAGLLSVDPWWGVAERAGASAFHVGAALLIARWWPLVFLLAPLHSALNASVLRIVRRRVALAEGLAVGVGGAVLAAGLVAWGV